MFLTDFTVLLGTKELTVTKQHLLFLIIIFVVVFVVVVVIIISGRLGLDEAALDLVADGRRKELLGGEDVAAFFFHLRQGQRGIDETAVVNVEVDWRLLPVFELDEGDPWLPNRFLKEDFPVWVPVEQNSTGCQRRVSEAVEDGGHMHANAYVSRQFLAAVQLEVDLPGKP